MIPSNKRHLASLLAVFLITLASVTSASAQSSPVAGVPVFGSAGPRAFTGQLTITQLALDEAGALVASGRVTGYLARQRISHAFRDIPVTLFASPAGEPVPLSRAIRPMALSPDEPLVCDILFLDLAPLHLDLLGLELDLAEVVLDLDAVSGPGALVGNLLCAVTGLLDAVPLGVLLQGILEAVLDAINGLLTP